MANYLTVFPVPDSHIEFLVKHPAALSDYAEGRLPKIEAKKPPSPTFWQRITGKTPAAVGPLVPTDWPTKRPAGIGPEINHRNVDLYHLILNGTMGSVKGSGSIFQTWFIEGPHSAIDLGDCNEDFAFLSHQVPELAALLDRIDLPKLRTRYTEWLRAQGDDYVPNDEECEQMLAEFQHFAKSTHEAVRNRHGLIWISN